MIESLGSLLKICWNGVTLTGYAVRVAWSYLLYDDCKLCLENSV